MFGINFNLKKFINGEDEVNENKNENMNENNAEELDRKFKSSSYDRVADFESILDRKVEEEKEEVVITPKEEKKQKRKVKFKRIIIAGLIIAVIFAVDILFSDIIAKIWTSVKEEITGEQQSVDEAFDLDKNFEFFSNLFNNGY